MYREIDIDIDSIIDEDVDFDVDIDSDFNEKVIYDYKIKNIKYPLLRQSDVLIDEMEF